MIRSLSSADCIGCGTCFKSCPLDVFRIDVHQPEISPCMGRCPAGNDVRAVHHLLQQGLFIDALDKLRETMPFPAVAGRVCFHPCEGACSRAEVDEAVNINGLEQFLGDMDLERDDAPPARRHIWNAAVVGSGPAGLACAWYLARLGYGVTVFEALPTPGGMLRHGIPAFRLPDRIVERSIEKMAGMGVRFRCGTPVGAVGSLSLDDLAREGFKAVFVGIGASAGVRAGVPGEDADGVWTGLDFLRAARGANAPAVGRRVVVVGGGNVAMDAAVTARKLGAEQVSVICLEQEEELPAYAHSIRDARELKVDIRYGRGLREITNDDGRASGLTAMRCLRVFDAQGRFAPEYDRNDAETLAADTVIMAIGQRAELGDLAGVLAHARGRLAVDPATWRSSLPHVFAAGDVVTGPSSVARAVAGGREAALSMDRFLRGADLMSGRGARSGETELRHRDKLPRIPRVERPRLVTPESFAESRRGFDLEQAMSESVRCLTCGSKAVIRYTDDCMTCYHCEVNCPAGAIDVHPFKEELPRTL